MAHLSAARVEHVFQTCLGGGRDVEGLVHKVSFNPERLKEHRKEIGAMLAELPNEFHHEGGGGWSFLNACQDRHGNQWTGEQQTMERLFMLGMATEQAEYLLPRDMWAMFPGGVPYVAVKPDKEAVGG